MTLGISVLAYGAAADGTTDDSSAFQAALDAAEGQSVTVPAGRYLISDVQLPRTSSLVLDVGAVLVHRSGGALPMFQLTAAAERFRLRGGAIDGRRSTIAGWPSIVRGALPSGKTIDIEDVHFTGTVAAVVRLTGFGGYLNFSRNRVTDQAQHSGVNGQFTTVVTIVNGQPGARGTIITDGNWHHFDAPLDHEGSNPGGYFVCTSPDVGGGATPFGNLSTWRAIGNHFRGYGQFGGPGTGTNDISPLHTYPTIKGARWVGNYFEACGFPAMSAKSVEDFVCTGNTIQDGMRSSRNHASEGAISYVPGYQAGSEVRARAVIANNTISNPGGEAVREQTGIAVKGTSTSKATDVTVVGNVYSGGGVGVDLVNVENAVVSNNILRCGTGTSPAGHGVGVKLSNVTGRVLISGNAIETSNGNCVTATSGNAGAHLTISGNELADERSGTGACILVSSVAGLKISGNVLFKPSGHAVYVSGVVGRYAYDESNTVPPHLTVSVSWSGIASGHGQLVGSATPIGRVTPGHRGATYRQTDGAGSALFIATGTTSADWSPVQTLAAARSSADAGTVALGSDGPHAASTASTTTSSVAGAALASDAAEQSPAAPHVGLCSFDTVLGKPTWWNGEAWVDAGGATI